MWCRESDFFNMDIHMSKLKIKKTILTQYFFLNTFSPLKTLQHYICHKPSVFVCIVLFQASLISFSGQFVDPSPNTMLFESS